MEKITPVYFFKLCSGCEQALPRTQAVPGLSREHPADQAPGSTVLSPGAAALQVLMSSHEVFGSFPSPAAKAKEDAIGGRVIFRLCGDRLRWAHLVNSAQEAK